MSLPADQSGTPLMRQYYEVKAQHPDKILFFRMGDFFEMFGDDAVKAAPILGIALTSRSHGGNEKIPLAGVPHHSAEKYLARLLEAGLKVVIVEQVEDPRTAKGIVKRDVVEILTPGTATLESSEIDLRPTWLAAVNANGKSRLGVAALDLATGQFLADEGPREDMLERLRTLEPREILVCRDVNEEDGGDWGLTVEPTPYEEWNFDRRTAEQDLNRHFGTTTLEGFGLGDRPLALSCAGAVYRYLRENHRDSLSHVDRITPFRHDEHMSLDSGSVRNLELVRNLRTSGAEHTLFAVINRCHTAAGSRRLMTALLRPYIQRTPIERRLGGVDELVRNRGMADAVRKVTSGLPDLERLAGRLGLAKLNPRQARNIRTCLIAADQLRGVLSSAHSPHLSGLASAIPVTTSITERIDRVLVDEPPLVVNRGDIIRRGYSPDLDALNDSIRDARHYIGSLQAKERQRTGIASLKVGYNKVFGYYIEITRTHSEQAPSDYIRKQTLVNAERYVTPELKEKEELITNAEEKIFALEQQLYAELVTFLDDNIAVLKGTADILAEIDLVAGLAELAVQKGYCRPAIFEDTRLRIVNGRHPVIESVLPPGAFVANDTGMIEPADGIHILTGPNMSGKSTYLRQVGLIVILAQIGSFVPADTAEIGLVDRVFTRVGAVDNLARGQSTFLVEMVETATILHNAGPRSLVLLDEIGRGTSTFDGLSVAWAVVEHIHDKLHSRTIFATHYHELTGMAELHERIRNFQVAVKKWEDQVVFLHQIIPGGCDDSYGIEVARLAGVPRSVIARARSILRLLESGKFTQSELGRTVYKEKVQPSLFEVPRSKVEAELTELEPDTLTPLEALELLHRWKREMS